MTSVADWRLAVDIGGTFTDLVLLDAASGQVVVEKVLTTPKAPLDGVRAGVRQLLAKAGVQPADITAPIVHATTLITNALIEGKIGRAAVVTTAGFGDTLLIRDEHRYDMYDLQIEFPAPPVPRELVVRDRRAHRGHRRRGRRADRRPSSTPSPSSCAAADVDAVGVCLLNTLRQPGQRARWSPSTCGAALGVPVCISSRSRRRSASTRG